MSLEALLPDSGSDRASSTSGELGWGPSPAYAWNHKVPLEPEQKQQLESPWGRAWRKYQARKKGYAWHDWLGEVLPCVAWIKTYDLRAWLVADMMAGLSVACMEVPQAMSYASLAGLPYVFGLYGAMLPCIVYAFFGSSRQLAVGPVSITSMLLASGLSSIFEGRVNQDPNNPADPALQEEYNRAAVQVAFLVGCVYSLVGLLRMGWITHFLSHSVTSGFMSGACIVVALSQVKHVLGIQMPREPHLIPELESIYNNLRNASPYEMTMGVSFILLLVLFKQLAARNKRLTFLRALGPITVSTLSILIMSTFKLYERPSPQHPYIQQLGHIPRGLPGFTGGWWFPLYAPGAQLTLAVLICLIDGVEAMSMAKRLALVHGYEHNATQDFRALGLANLAGSAFSAYNTTGSLSRSAVNSDVGAKTPLAGGISGLLLALTLLFLTPLFTHMSKNVQGAIIIVGVLSLFDWRECVFLFRVNKPDWVVWMVAFLATMLLGVFRGVLSAVAVALVLVIYKSAFPRIATLGRLPNTHPGLYRNRKMYPTTLEEPGLLLLRIDSPLYFANVQPVKEGIRKALRKARQRHELHAVILDLSPVVDMDATAVHFLNGFVDELRAEGLDLALANPSQQVVRLLRRSGLLAKLGEERLHVNLHSAVEHSRSGASLSQLEYTI